jgi:hypothetical protein
MAITLAGQDCPELVEVDCALAVETSTAPAASAAIM